ncbi:MAG: hypothetical protein KIT33_14345 [Candidatus Kapabacteria bacterium]|nr:hypothetical protein [Ignavibacteriota bacterium]MCW5886147.1 hypothetical protein [Candidatus Kapabacteria bacterium]
MKFKINSDIIKKIDDTLGAEHQTFEGAVTWTLKSPDNFKPLVFTIYQDVHLGDIEGAMVSVQTRHGYYELHDISAMMFFEPDEVIFIQNDTDKLSCLIIGSECTCSLYSNISKELLRQDFAELHPAVILSAMQLSITESVLD